MTRLRTVLLSLLLAATCAAAGCAAQQAVGVSAPNPAAQRVRAALDQWPVVRDTAAPGLKRPFFATIRIVGQRTTASGVLDYHNPRDFRITAATELGVILFDARMNWAGVTVLRQMPGLPKPSVEALVGDLSTAFHLPASLDGLVSQGGDTLVLKRTEADTHKYTWTFDGSTGRLKQIDVDLGAFDTLHIQFKAYDGRGWPEELAVSRKARFYTINLSFTDDPVARSARAASGRVVARRPASGAATGGANP
jgi:hypothetical protein